jgi:transcriptional regulator with XRE-family HTH domain
MPRVRTYSGATREALRLLGDQIRAARQARRFTAQELADRVGISKVTLLKIEHGEPSVRLGDAFEAATLIGVPLFHPDPERRRLEAARLDDRLAALPQRVRRPVVDNDF